MNINQHVVQREQGWAVLGEGNQRDTVVLPTQEAAIAKARAIAHNQGGKLIIHSPHGRIRDDRCNSAVQKTTTNNRKNYVKSKR